ncbi:MAG: branched-chain amino acid transaminase [Acidobacteriaceae bacterium]
MKTETAPNVTVYFNNQFMPLQDARVGVLTHALHYGTGVFEGIRAYWNAEQQELYMVRLPEHYQRWKKNCGILRIDVPMSPEELCDITVELMRRNQFRSNVYVRPLAYKSAERVGVSLDDQDSFTIVGIPFGDYLPSEQGLHAGIVSWRRIEDNAIPARAKICGAYVNSALAEDEARRNGFDEAIFLSESGHVAEGATCNLFMVRKGKLITPSTTENTLEGITRDSIMELARKELHLEVVERPIDRSELYVCDELFLTGTAVGMAPVTRIDHRPVGDAKLGAISTELRRLYFDAMHGRMDGYRKWLTPAYKDAPVGVDA